MMPAQLNALILPAALTLLGPRYDTPEARAMLIAIALQESGLRSRKQNGGPALSYWQFELRGVQGVVNHQASWKALKAACDVLDYSLVSADIHQAIQHNDILAAVCARLLLYTSPKALPKKTEMMDAFTIYNHDLWKPGKERFETWPDNWAKAWETVEAK